MGRRGFVLLAGARTLTQTHANPFSGVLGVKCSVFGKIELNVFKGLGVWLTLSIDVSVSLEVDLQEAIIVKTEQQEESKMSNINRNIMKSVKSGIVALLERLVADSTSSETQKTESTLRALPGRRHGGSNPPRSTTLNKAQQHAAARLDSL